MNGLQSIYTLDIAQVFSFGAILVMAYCLWLVVSLKANVPGGIIGKRWNLLMGLVMVFTVGYLTTPFFSALPEDVLRLIVGVIFLLGALYVVLTVKLIYRVIQELTE
ncbi:MAG: hypothetical protein M0R77_11520 [Gammaproteobacteria bacterium]|nr:hypothetical protein [Gammaproteobacteria bacterium]